MRTGDTSIGEGGKTFPATQWSMVAGIQDPATTTRRKALESLFQRYWKPVYLFFRRAWSKPSEDAKDLTQAFFQRILEGEPLRNYQVERGSFRTFLKVILRGFAADQQDALKRLKSGGGVKHVSIEADSEGLGEFIPDANGDPVEVFDRDWKREVLKRAFERTKEWFQTTGREHQYRAFEAYTLAEGGEKPTQSEVAEKLGIKPTDVANYLHAVRSRLEEEVRAELSQTVRTPEELDAEYNDLFSI